MHIMVSKYLTHVIKQDIVTKTSFFTAGELLDIYLLNEQTVSVAYVIRIIMFLYIGNIR